MNDSLARPFIPLRQQMKQPELTNVKFQIPVKRDCPILGFLPIWYTTLVKIYWGDMCCRKDYISRNAFLFECVLYSVSIKLVYITFEIQFGRPCQVYTGHFVIHVNQMYNKPKLWYIREYRGSWELIYIEYREHNFISYFIS